MHRMPAEVRRGLAPLEMALGLPIILLLFALMINAGFTGIWKLRLLGASQEVAWRERDQRTTMSPPAYHTRFWNQSEGVDGNFENPITTERNVGDNRILESIEDNAESKNAPYVRVGFKNLQVDQDLLDPKRGAHQITTSTEKDFPLLTEGLQAMKVKLGHILLSHSLPYWKTKLPRSLSRRSKVLYGPTGKSREIYPIEEDRAGGNLPPLSKWAIHPSELGFDFFLSTATMYDTSLASQNLKPIAGHDVTNSTLTALGGIERYHDPERYNWRYVGKFLDRDFLTTGAKWTSHNLMPGAPEFMPEIPAGIFQTNSTGSTGLNEMKEKLRTQIEEDIKPRIEDDPDKRTKHPNPRLKETEGNLIYHLSTEYQRFYGEAIGIVSHHVNHLNDKIEEGNAYLRLDKQHPLYDPKKANIYKRVIADATLLLPIAVQELERRKAILEPIIDNLAEYKRDF